MALPSISDLKMWVGTLFTKDDWDFNFSKITSWLSDGNADLVVNSIKPTNGIDMDGAKITNVGAATTGSDAVNLDTATTLLNRTSYYYPFSVASGKVSSGLAAYLQKDSDTQVTVLAGNTNPDLVVIQSDGTVESVTSNTVLTVSTSDGTYNVVKEKAQSIVITSGKVTVGNTQPASPSAGDYFLDNSTVPFKGYKYNAVGGWTVTEFCHLGSVTVASGVATVNQFAYNNNKYDVNVSSLGLVMPNYSAGISVTVPYSTSKFTAPSDGIYVALTYANERSVSLYINNIATTFITRDQAQAASFSNICAPLSKGDEIYWASGLDEHYGAFYPYKGGN